LRDQIFHSNATLSPGNQIYLERPHIDQLLEKAVQNRAIIVCAGAGYGKTHAVYSFVRKYNARISWIQLSERDNISERFWENFIAGVTLTNKRAATQLTKIDFPETERQFDRYLNIPETATRRNEKYLFVYDDFHLLHNKTVLRFLERAITSPFPNITSIVISRNEPAINLINLFSRGLLGRITEEDLRFSREEIVKYFRLQNINPSSQAISSIYHDTEGWAFAIHLAGLSLKNAPPGTGYVPQAMRSNIFKLIESEIMAVISADLRKFLIKLSLIDHLVPELLQEIAGGKPLIEEMEQISSFIHFDTYLNAYQIHHLLEGYLQEQQKELSEEEKRDVYWQTAGWCAQNNQKMDAINYYEKAKDYENIIKITDDLPLILPAHFARFILEMLDRFSQEVYYEHPLIYAVRARTLTSLRMFEQCEKELQELIPRIEAQPLSPKLHWLLMALYANLGLIDIITSTYTRDYRFTGLIEKAAYHGRLTDGHVLQPPLAVINLGSYICRVHNPEKGEIEDYINAITEALSHVPAIGGCGWGMDDLARAELVFFKGDMAGAEQFAQKALLKAREWEQYEIENRALFFLLRIHLSRGNFGGIQEIFRQMEAQLEKPQYFNRFAYHDIANGWYFTQIGQTEKLAPWLKNDFEESDLNSMSHGMEILVKAKYHFAEKRYPAALAALENRDKKYEAGDFVIGMIEIYALKALCLYHLRDRKAAFAVLEEAYKLSRPNALYMPFMELGKNMRALAGAALKDKATAIPPAWLERVRRNASTYAKKLFVVIEQYRQPEKSRVRAAPAGAALSRREQEVLAELSQGLTREEIASHLSISVNTVKSVIRSIYNKLGAVNRADAVRIATSLGLL
jgi:LuxR family maltose regulon positive regulatory protein